MVVLLPRHICQQGTVAVVMFVKLKVCWHTSSLMTRGLEGWSITWHAVHFEGLDHGQECPRYSPDDVAVPQGCLHQRKPIHHCCTILHGQPMKPSRRRATTCRILQARAQSMPSRLL